MIPGELKSQARPFRHQSKMSTESPSSEITHPTVLTYTIMSESSIETTSGASRCIASKTFIAKYSVTIPTGIANMSSSSSNESWMIAGKLNWNFYPIRFKQSSFIPLLAVASFPFHSTLVAELESTVTTNKRQLFLAFDMLRSCTYVI